MSSARLQKWDKISWRFFSQTAQSAPMSINPFFHYFFPLPVGLSLFLSYISNNLLNTWVQSFTSSGNSLASYQHPKLFWSHSWETFTKCWSGLLPLLKSLIPFSGDINNTSNFHISSSSLDKHHHKPCPTHLTMNPKVYEPSLDHIYHGHPEISGCSELNITKREISILNDVIMSIYVLLPNFIPKNFLYPIKTCIFYLLSMSIHKK